MSDRLRAEEDLRAIRALMERVTVYRAISAPTALVAGALSLLAGAAVYLSNEASVSLGRPLRSRQFAIAWIVVFLISAAANAFFVWREARRSGRPFISAGMKLALRAIVPCLLIPAAFTGWFLTTGYLGGQELVLVTVWIAFYGMALLSTQVFAPRSLVILGWAFLLSGLAVPVVVDTIAAGFSSVIPNFLMAVTFGLYHLIYAACVWRRKTASSTEPPAVE